MAENGGNHAAGMAGNGAAENGGDHAHAVAVLAANGGGQAPAAVVHAENGGDHVPAVAVDANGDGEVADPAPAVPAANGGNAALVHAADGAMGNAAAVFLDLNLMQEAAIYQFLIRLPAAMVARGRAVCRLWRDITSTEVFLRDHHFHRSLHPMPLFFYRRDHQVAPLGDQVRIHLRAADIRRRESLPVLRFTHLDPALPFPDPRVFQIEGSCDGILLLSYGDNLYACNPCTRRWARLPEIHRFAEIIGFYACDVGDGREYRVLYHSEFDDWERAYSIVSFPELAVRFIGRPTNLESEALDLVLAGGIRPSFEMPPVMVQERLHWQPQLDQENSHLLVFNTADEQEEFTWIRPPRVLLDGNRWVQFEGEQLFESNGRLAMIVVSRTVVDVWVLQDYVGQAWAYEYQIQLPVAAIQAHRGYVVDDGYEEAALSAVVFAVSEDRNVLVRCTHAFLQCDANGTLLQTYQLPANFIVLSGYMIQESLLPHAFLPLSHTDAHDGDPPFFQAP